MSIETRLWHFGVSSSLPSSLQLLIYWTAREYDAGTQCYLYNKHSWVNQRWLMMRARVSFIHTMSIIAQNLNTESIISTVCLWNACTLYSPKSSLSNRSTVIHHLLLLWNRHTYTNYDYGYDLFREYRSVLCFFLGVGRKGTSVP